MKRRFNVFVIIVVFAAALTLTGCGALMRAGMQTMQKDNPAPSVSTTTPSATPSSPTPTASKKSGPYNIMDGFTTKEDGSILYFYGNDFMLAMPNNNLWGYEQIDDNTVKFYLVESRNSGYGGHLVTIRAYDANDNSYENIPHYAVAGTGSQSGKRFVAIFPTDVQYDGGNSTEASHYRELYDHVRKIGEGAANSPFATSN